MSQTKLQAARELIQEKHYAAARAVLETIPTDPTASQWLAKLNQIAPAVPTAPPVSHEAERYFRAENRARNRRRFGSGIEAIIAGIGVFFLAGFLGIRPAGAPGAGITIAPDPVLVVLGIILVVAGVVLMRRRD